MGGNEAQTGPGMDEISYPESLRFLKLWVDAVGRTSQDELEKAISDLNHPQRDEVFPLYLRIAADGYRLYSEAIQLSKRFYAQGHIEEAKKLRLFLEEILPVRISQDPKKVAKERALRALADLEQSAGEQ